ncbi:MAG TPA: gamma-glutamylcyclotransferase family protein [Planctomycetota bacterium]|nr:gamma-glutamylcyclotransferase family protein [Planctomycetota bacterium]
MFVYGPLRRGGAKHVLLLQAGARPVADGTIAGKLFDLGKYPAAVKATDRKSRIRGEIYAFADPATGLARLDRAEGYDPARTSKSVFARRIVEVALDGGKTLDAWAYFYNRPVRQAREVAGGEWRVHLPAAR